MFITGGHMKFTISRDIFVKALQKVQGIIETRKTMPILSNVLIEALHGKIYITATDLEVGMKSSYDASVVEEGKITVSAKKLYEILKELPEAEINFSTRENDWVDIQCGKARFNIVGLSPDEFPFLPKIDDTGHICISCSTLNKMVEKTAYAICQDETKYNLNGIFFKTTETDGTMSLKLVATDGHRLSLAESYFSDGSGTDLNKGVIFPKKGIYEIKKITEDEAGEVFLSFVDNNAVLKKGDTVLIMRLVDGEFPDYNRVLPAGNNNIAVINRNDFLHSLRRMSILSSDKFKGVKLEVQNGSMEISANNPELGEAHENMEINYSGDATAIRFNARYIIDVLSVLDDDEIELHLKDDLSPAILKPLQASDFLSVIMPMRL
jgi:DNA polymerase-3 subunit beta